MNVAQVTDGHGNGELFGCGNWDMRFLDTSRRHRLVSDQ
jgi:hypothetical protein